MTDIRTRHQRTCPGTRNPSASTWFIVRRLLLVAFVFATSFAIACGVARHEATDIAGVTTTPGSDDASTAPDTTQKYWLGLGPDTCAVRERARAIAGTAGKFGADSAKHEFDTLPPRMKKAVASALVPIRTEVLQEAAPTERGAASPQATYRSVTWCITGYARIGVIFRYWHTATWTTDYSRITSVGGPFNDGNGYCGWSYTGSRSRSTLGGGAGSGFWDSKTGGRFVLFGNNYVNLGTATPWMESICYANGTARAWGSS
jgi:hypothetical protein